MHMHGSDCVLIAVDLSNSVVCPLPHSTETVNPEFAVVDLKSYHRLVGSLVSRSWLIDNMMPSRLI